MQTSLLGLAAGPTAPAARCGAAAPRRAAASARPAATAMRAGVPVLSPRAVRGAAARPLGPARCAPVNSTPSFADRRTIDSMDDSSLYDTSECPHGNVVSLMRGDGVLVASPNETLTAILPKLDKVTGLPVIGDDGECIGVISRKDIIKIRKGKVQGSMDDKVAQHMTSPAIVIDQNASVRSAADLMLARNIRRLPVIDAETGKPVGILSKSDIFKPLFKEKYNLFMKREAAAIGGGLTVLNVNQDGSATPVTWRVKYLYDGDCPMCLSLKNVLSRQDNNRELIRFVNIADPNYDAASHMGIAYSQAMETIHAIKPDGTVLRGTDALFALFDAVGLGWATRLAELPIVAKLVDVLYNFLSKNRLSLGGITDGIIAAKRMDMSKQGVETCSDVDEQCEAEW